MSRRAFSVAIFARHTRSDGRRRVLLIKHKRLGTWLPVGGEIEPGESPLEAAVRELREETGLVGRFPRAVDIEGTPEGLVAYEEHEAGSKGLHMNFCFVADVDRDDVPAHEEFTEARFVDEAHDLPCPTNVAQLVQRVLRPDDEPAALDALARRWLAAFNARDLDGLLALYSDDAVHTSPKLRDRRPETRGEVRGQAELRAWWADAMTRLPQLRYEAQHLTASRGRVFMEYLRRCPPEPDLVVAEVLVVERGLIVASHVFHG